MKRTLIIIATITAILVGTFGTFGTAAFTAHAAPKTSPAHAGGSRRHCGAILANSKNQPCFSHNQPHITATQSTSKRGALPIIAPPKFTRVLFSGDVQHEIQESVPAHFTVSLMCDGGYVTYTITDQGGDVTGAPGMTIEKRTIMCDNASHTLNYDFPLSDNVAILVDRLTTVTVTVV